MSNITTLVLTKGIVASVITLVLAFIGFTVCSIFGLDTTGVSYVAPFIGMWFAVSVGDFSIDTVRHESSGGFFANASNMKVLIVLCILNLIVFFIITGFAMPFLFGSSFSPRPYYGISYSIFMIFYAIVWILYSAYRSNLILKN